MAIIKKFSPFQNLSSFQVFLNDTERTSQYFKITEFEDTLTGGKNGFLIEGSEYLKETTEVKVELLDVENNPIYFEPGDGIPEYYEGISKLISVHVYDDTPIGTGKITILGELKNYIDENGAVVPVPDEWKGIYNVKWERTFQVNKNLNNETIVRFYKRPIVNITELVKPIFSKSIPTVTDTGYAHGISETPIDGTDIRNWRAGTLYRLRRTNGTWDRDVDENTITFTSPSFTANIVEVLNDTDVLVNVPYTVNNLVSNFTSGSYSVSYADFQNEVVGESTLTGSFAKIDITQLKTFVGDVARVKVFRKSRNSVGDFQFVQESKLESTELLRDVTTPSNTEIPYGRFDETNLSTYWITSSDDHEVSIDSSVLSQAVKFDYDSVQGGVQRLITSQSFSISKDVEYTLNFRTLLSGSLDDSGKSVRAFFSSSNFTQDFLTASGSAIYRTRQNVSQNILSENTGDAHLVFEVKGDDWYVSNVSLKNAQDTSFSPDEFTLIQDIPRKLVSETFDFRFEFYDINNNYIPVDVTAVGVFDGGNDFPTSGKLLTFESDRNAFRFTSGSIGSPPFQQLQFKVTQNNLTGSVSFASSAFDEDGNYIDPSSYGGTYPGTLTSVTPAGAILRIADFSGSDESVIVGSIVYTASLEGLEEFETVYRLEDGDNAPTLLVTSNANQFTYEPTSLTPKPVGQTITVRAQRKNLASLVTPITVNSGSNRPALTYVDTVGGIDTYTISATEFSSSFSANSFDEVTYQFTGSDVFGIEQTDEITLSKVVNFDGVSITLSNESTSFRSNGQGLILDSFDSGDGEVEVRIADKEIDHSNGLSSPNTFDIVSATATNVTEAYSSYLTNEYGISAMSADSGSLVLNISYLAGDNSTTQSFQKKVNYNKNRIAQPSIIIDTTNKNQNVDAKSTGQQSTPFEDSTITVREFYTGSVTTFPSSDVAISFDSNPSTIATDNGDLTLSFNNLANATNSTQVQFTATVTDSEGTSRSVSDSISLSKTLDAAPNVEIQAYPAAQSIQADSNGSGSNSPVDLSIVALEGGANRGVFAIGTITTTGGLTVNTPTSPYTTISFSSDASDMTSDTGTLTIPVTTTNTELSYVTKNVVVTVTRVRKAVPSVIVSADIPSQVVTANSAGTQTGTLSNVSVSALEGGTSVFDSMTVAGSSGFDSTPTVSSSTLQLSSRTLTSDSGLVTLTVNYTDSEGNENSQSLVINASKVEQPAGAVTIELNPPNQAVPIDIQDTITAPSTFLVQVFDSEGSFTHSSTLASNATFKITNLSQTNTSGTPANSNGTITPATPSNANGSNVTFDVTYKGRDGLTSDAISKTHSVRVISEGSTGPGIVFTGPWDTNRIYQYDISNGRRDAVLYSGRYFATLQTTTTSTPAPTTGGDSYWEDLGTDSFFVAGEIAIFTNSYVQEVLNIGTTSNTLSAANITLNGSDAYPYFSLGQSATVGTQEFGANGIFIGRHDDSKNTDATDGAYVMSLSNGTNYMKWDGSTLDIKGQLTISGESSPLDVDEITNSSDPMGGGTLNYNPNMTIVAKDGRPDGVKSVYHSNVASNISYENTAKSILKVYSSSDTSIGAGFPAIKINKDAKYIIHFRVKTTSSNVSSGFYFRMQEYDGELPQDITHICHNASSGESGVVEDTRQITQGSKLVVNTPSGGDIDNGPITTSFVDYIVTYTPTSTAKWVSPIFLNWTDMGTRELHVDRLAIMVDTSDKDQGTVGGWTITSTEIQGGSPSGGGDGSFTTQGMRLGAGGYISAEQFYIDSSGNAKFAGSLSVGGVDTAVSTVVDGAADGASSLQPGDAASDVNSNTTTIQGGKIRTGDIQSTGYSGTVTDGSDFSTSGMNISLDDGSITAPNFRINTSGDAFFSGVVSGSVITGGLVSGSSFQGGSINIGDGAFTVDSLGFVSASNASIGGSIVTDDAILGGWLVDENAITSEDGNVTLHATDEYIQVSDANGIPRATLSTESTLPNPSSGGTNHTQGNSSSPINPTDQTVSVGPPSGIGNSDSDSGTLTHNLTSFTTGTSGAHSFAYTYSVSNRNRVSATGMMSSATMSIRVKIYSDASYSTLVGQTSTWSISAYGYDTSGGFASVIGNTKILLSNGFIKKAKDITKNDKLLVWDYKTNQFVESNIQKINKRKVNNIYRVSLSNGLVVDVSDNHGFWLDNNEQIFVAQLIEGESKIYIKDDSDISLQLVTKVEIINTEEEVFTFKIPNYENYISNGILSHNPSFNSGFPEQEINFMSAPQNRSGTATLANNTTYYPRIECSYSLVTYGMDSYDSSRGASLRFDHQGYFSVNSVSAGMTTNAAGFQVNSNDTKVFRLETGAASSNAFGTFIGGLTIDGFEHGRYLPMDTSVDTDSSYGISSSNRAKLDLFTWSYAAGRAQCTVTFNESTSVATLQNFSSTNYACVNVDGISFTNINSNYSQSLRVNFITGPSSHKWTPLVMSYGRTAHSAGNDADGIFNEESVNNHAARMYPTDSSFNTTASYCIISIRDNDGNGVRVPEVLQLVCLG